jgi:hypothetical protein
MLPGAASVMTHAIRSPSSAKSWVTASRSLYGSTRVSAVAVPGTPGVPGTASVVRPEPAEARRESTWPW